MKQQRRRSMPVQKPGKSKQDYGTPDDFIEAVERRFGPLGIDLAATKQNAKAPSYVTPKMDSLSDEQQWHTYANVSMWLNPPFGNIGPWAKKCAEQSARFKKSNHVIFFLTPASVGANWFRDHIFNKALVLALNGRLCFDGRAGFPKDCMLSVFRRDPPRQRFDVWTWKEQRELERLA